jgi:hypothetical protein
MSDIQGEDQGDGFEAEFDAAREAEEHDEAPAEVNDEGEEQADEAAPRARAPLTPEELDKRYRQTSKALKETRNTYRSQIEELKAQVEALKTAPQRQQAQVLDDGPPDPEVDPIGALKYGLKRLGMVDEQEAQTAQQRQAQERQQQESNALAAWGREQEEDFREDKPDYDKAAEHFATSRLKELAEEGVPANQIQQEFMSELAGLMKRAKASGKNPAEIVYTLAQRRGYGKNAGIDKLGKVARGQEQARSLSSGGGRPASTNSDLTFDKVAALSGAAFDSAFAKLKASQRRG